MELKEKHVKGLTLSMLSKTNQMDTAKQCTIEGLYALAQRDREWVDFVKEKYNIDVDYAPLRAQYEQAIEAVKKY